MNLREVNLKDKELLYKWVNDDECRKNSLNTANITMEEHEKWLLEVVHSKEKIIYILEQDGNSVGQVRLEKKEKGWRISYSIVKEFRGMGYGKVILKMLENKLANDRQEIILYAEVKKDNVASQRVFEYLKYDRYEDKDYFIYVKQKLEEQKAEYIRGGVYCY